MGPHPGRPATSEEEIRLGWRMAGLAFYMASEVMAGTLLGWLFDRFAGTAPNGLLVGAILGIAVGMLSFIRGALRMNKLLSKAEARRPLPPPLVDDETNDDDWPDDPHDDAPNHDR